MMPRSVTKTTGRIAVIAGFVLTAASAARAQAPAPPAQGDTYVTLSAGGQTQKRSFSQSSTFQSFDETGTIAGNQTVGGGAVFDLTGTYLFSRHVGVGVGIWRGAGSGAAAATAAMPDPLFRGRFATVTVSAADLKQTTVGLNLQLVWTTSLAERLDLSVFGGPALVHVSQKIGSVAVTPNTQSASLAIVSQSKTTGKAGNAGADLAYAINEHYGADFFIRYAGGQVDLPAVNNLNVGGLQLGGGIRYRF